jgi:hypothetical protein
MVGGADGAVVLMRLTVAQLPPVHQTRPPSKYPLAFDGQRPAGRLVGFPRGRWPAIPKQQTGQRRADTKHDDANQEARAKRDRHGSAFSTTVIDWSASL